MKQLWKIEDRAINNLLRLQMGRGGGTGSLCKEFDPDLANSYVERVLPASARSRYEHHLSECASCRKSTVALMRMAGDVVGSHTDAVRVAGRRVPGGFVWLRDVFASPGAQRWAIPAVAVLALALAIPLIVSRKETQSQQAALETGGAQAGREAQGGSAPASAQGGDLAINKADTNFARAAQVAARPEGQNNAEAGGPNEPQSGQPVAPGAEPPLTQAVDANLSPAGSNEAARSLASQAQLAAATSDVAPPPVAEERLTAIDSKTALKLPEENKDSTHASVLKPGRIDGEQKTDKEMTATIKPEDSIAPPPESTTPSGFISRRLADGTVTRFKSRDRGREASNRRGLEERKVAGKKFHLIRGVWTDKDYNPDKEMPFVPLTRDTDVYRDVLAKRGGLKQVFDGFAPGDNVIVIYKGTVYRLIPQENQK